MGDPTPNETGTGPSVDTNEHAHNMPATGDANASTAELTGPGDPQDDNDNQGVDALHEFLNSMNEDGEPTEREAELQKLDHMLNGSFREHVNTKDDRERTALHLAATRGSVGAATMLIKAGADIDARDDWGDTPLDDACREGHEKVVSLLVDEHAKTDSTNISVRSTLYTASEKGHVKIVELMLQKDSSTLHFVKAPFNWTALHVAVEFEQNEIVDLLLRNGANLDSVDVDYWTPLMVATRDGKKDMMKKLLESSQADESRQLEIKDNDGNTPLMRAVMNEFPAGVKILICAGADCNTESNTGETPIMAACSSGNQSIVLALLKQETGAPVDINAQDNDGKTALHCAILGDHAEVVKLLLNEAKLDVMTQDDDGRSPLHLASLKGNEAILKMLLGTEAGQHLDILDERDMTPIHVAIDASDVDEDSFSDRQMSDHLDTAEQENLDLRSGRHGAVIRLLLERGARLDIKSGKDLLVLASECRDRGFMDFVVQRIYVQFCKDWLTSSANNVNSEQSSGGFASLLAWAASDPKRHYAAQMLIMERHEAQFKPDPPNSKDWGAIEWAAWAGLPKELWLIIATSPPNRATIDAINRAKKWVNTDVDMKTRGAVQDKDKSIAEVFPASSQNEMRIASVKKELKFVKSKREKELVTTKSAEVQEKIRDIIEDPPIASMQVWEDSRTLSLPAFDKESFFVEQQDHDHEEHLRFLKGFKAVLMQFYRTPTEFTSIRRNRAVQQVIYENTTRRIQDIMENAKEDVNGYVKDFKGINHGTGKKEAPIYAKSNSKFTWIHLPFTNMLWMEDLLQRIMHDGRYTPQDFLQIKSFLRNSWVEVPDRTSKSRMMRPRFVMTDSVKDVDNGENETDKKGNETAREGTDDSIRKVGRVRSVGQKEMPVIDEAANLDERGQSERTEEKKEAERQDSKRGIAVAATYMPYLSYSMHSWKFDDDKNDEERSRHTKEHFRTPAQGPRERVAEKYDDDRKKDEHLLYCYKKHVIHAPATLDEWYYHFPIDDDSQNDRRHRNETQVVSEHMLEGTRAVYGSHWPLVRVNQLWMWNIDKKWLITASPPCTADGSKDILLEGILNHLEKQREAAGQPGSTDKMSKLIVDYCIGSYERRPSSQGQNLTRDLSIRQVFSNSINTIARGETKLFEQLRDQSETWRKHLQAQADQDHDEKKNTATSAYGEELRKAVKKAENLSAKIKDIRDELNILKAVAQYQRDVQERTYWGYGGKEMAKSGNDVRRILGADLSAEHIVNDIKEMDTVADRIQAAVNTTLSLQQSEIANLQAQLSVEQGREAVEQGEESVRQGREAEKQGRTLMVFTVVTILFLPLSFLSSLFALDVASFQQAPGWAFAVIFSVSIAFFVPVTAAASYSEKTAELLKPLRDRIFHFVSNVWNLLSFSRGDVDGGGDVDGRAGGGGGGPNPSRLKAPAGLRGTDSNKSTPQERTQLGGLSQFLPSRHVSKGRPDEEAGV